MNTTDITIIEASAIAISANRAFPLFATVRLRKDSNIVLDGRIYKTQEGMRKHRASRPKSAVMIKINGHLESKSGGRYFSVELLEA